MGRGRKTVDKLIALDREGLERAMLKEGLEYYHEVSSRAGLLPYTLSGELHQYRYRIKERTMMKIAEALGVDWHTLATSSPQAPPERYAKPRYTVNQVAVQAAMERLGAESGVELSRKAGRSKGWMTAAIVNGKASASVLKGLGEALGVDWRELTEEGK